MVKWRLLYPVDPAAVVVDAVAAASGDIKIHASEVGQLIAVGVSGCCGEDSAIKLTIATALSIKRRGAIADHEDDSLPSGIPVIMEVSCHDEKPVSRVGTQVEAAVNVDDLRIVC